MTGLDAIAGFVSGADRIQFAGINGAPPHGSAYTFTASVAGAAGSMYFSATAANPAAKTSF